MTDGVNVSSLFGFLQTPSTPFAWIQTTTETTATFAGTLALSLKSSGVAKSDSPTPTSNSEGKIANSVFSESEQADSATDNHDISSEPVTVCSSLIPYAVFTANAAAVGMPVAFTPTMPQSTVLTMGANIDQPSRPAYLIASSLPRGTEARRETDVGPPRSPVLKSDETVQTVDARSKTIGGPNAQNQQTSTTEKASATISAASGEQSSSEIPASGVLSSSDITKSAAQNSTVPVIANPTTGSIPNRAPSARPVNDKQAVARNIAQPKIAEGTSFRPSSSGQSAPTSSYAAFSFGSKSSRHLASVQSSISAATMPTVPHVEYGQGPELRNTLSRSMPSQTANAVTTAKTSDQSSPQLSKPAFTVPLTESDASIIEPGNSSADVPINDVPVMPASTAATPVHQADLKENAIVTHLRVMDAASQPRIIPKQIAQSVPSATQLPQINVVEDDPSTNLSASNNTVPDPGNLTIPTSSSNNTFSATSVVKQPMPYPGSSQGFVHQGTETQLNQNQHEHELELAVASRYQPNNSSETESVAVPVNNQEGAAETTTIPVLKTSIQQEAIPVEFQTGKQNAQSVTIPTGNASTSGLTATPAVAEPEAAPIIHDEAAADIATMAVAKSPGQTSVSNQAVTSRVDSRVVTTEATKTGGIPAITSIFPNESKQVVAAEATGVSDDYKDAVQLQPNNRNSIINQNTATETTGKSDKTAVSNPSLAPQSPTFVSNVANEPIVSHDTKPSLTEHTTNDSAVSAPQSETQSQVETSHIGNNIPNRVDAVSSTDSVSMDTDKSIVTTSGANAIQETVTPVIQSPKFTPSVTIIKIYKPVDTNRLGINTAVNSSNCRSVATTAVFPTDEQQMSPVNITSPVSDQYQTAVKNELANATNDLSEQQRMPKNEARVNDVYTEPVFSVPDTPFSPNKPLPTVKNSIPQPVVPLESVPEETVDTNTIGIPSIKTTGDAIGTPIHASEDSGFAAQPKQLNDVTQRTDTIHVINLSDPATDNAAASQKMEMPLKSMISASLPDIRPAIKYASPQASEHSQSQTESMRASQMKPTSQDTNEPAFAPTTATTTHAGSRQPTNVVVNMPDAVRIDDWTAFDKQTVVASTLQSQQQGVNAATNTAARPTPAVNMDANQLPINDRSNSTALPSNRFVRLPNNFNRTLTDMGHPGKLVGMVDAITIQNQDTNDVGSMISVALPAHAVADLDDIRLGTVFATQVTPAKPTVRPEVLQQATGETTKSGPASLRSTVVAPSDTDIASVASSSNMGDAEEVSPASGLAMPREAVANEEESQTRMPASGGSDDELLSTFNKLNRNELSGASFTNENISSVESHPADLGIAGESPKVAILASNMNDADNNRILEKTAQNTQQTPSTPTSVIQATDINSVSISSTNAVKQTAEEQTNPAVSGQTRPTEKATQIPVVQALKEVAPSAIQTANETAIPSFGSNRLPEFEDKHILVTQNDQPDPVPHISPKLVSQFAAQVDQRLDAVTEPVEAIIAKEAIKNNTIDTDLSTRPTKVAAPIVQLTSNTAIVENAGPAQTHSLKPQVPPAQNDGKRVALNTNTTTTFVSKQVASGQLNMQNTGDDTILDAPQYATPAFAKAESSEKPGAVSAAILKPMTSNITNDNTQGNPINASSSSYYDHTKIADGDMTEPKSTTGIASGVDVIHSADGAPKPDVNTGTDSVNTDPTTDAPVVSLTGSPKPPKDNLTSHSNDAIITGPLAERKVQPSTDNVKQTKSKSNENGGHISKAYPASKSTNDTFIGTADKVIMVAGDKDIPVAITPVRSQSDTLPSIFVDNKVMNDSTAVMQANVSALATQQGAVLLKSDNLAHLNDADITAGLESAKNAASTEQISLMPGKSSDNDTMSGGDANSAKSSSKFAVKGNKTSERSFAGSIDNQVERTKLASVPVIKNNFAHSQTQTRAQVVTQILNKLDSMRLASGKNEVTIHLKPDNLGDIQITITTVRDSVNARIVADTQSAKQAVEAGRSDLRNALEQKGYTLQGLDVSLNQNGTDRRFIPFVPEQRSIQPKFTEQSTNEHSTPHTVMNRRSHNEGRLDYQV